jgi:hypothetical protein
MTITLSTATPAEIDAQLAPIYARYSAALGSKAEALNSAEQFRRYGTRYASSVARYEATAEKAQTAMDAADAEMAPFEAEYTARGGWTRFFMVMNAGGHLHSSRHCSTCRWTTQFAWLPEYSGQDESGIVELAGEDACTVCFPSAPVDRQSRLPFRVAEREIAEKLAVEKAAKAAAKAAQRVVVGSRVFTTRRGAENEVGQLIGYAVSARFMDASGPAHRDQLDSLVAEYVGKARSIAEALADGTDGYDPEALLAKKFDAKAKEYRKAGWAIPADATL